MSIGKVAVLAVALIFASGGVGAALADLNDSGADVPHRTSWTSTPARTTRSSWSSRPRKTTPTTGTRAVRAPARPTRTRRPPRQATETNDGR